MPQEPYNNNNNNNNNNNLLLLLLLLLLHVLLLSLLLLNRQIKSDELSVSNHNQQAPFHRDGFSISDPHTSLSDQC